MPKIDRLLESFTIENIHGVIPGRAPKAPGMTNDDSAQPLTALKEFLRNRGGSMAVEFVATIPILLVALIFSFEFGRALWAYDVITRDVRAAIRYLSRAPSTSTDQANCMAMTGLPVGAPPTCGSNPKHFPWTTGTPIFTYSTTAVNGAQFSLVAPGDSVIIMTANVPFTLAFPSFSGIGPGFTLTLSVSDQVRWIGS
jgi:Flp pilus assembly protein TadG